MMTHTIFGGKVHLYTFLDQPILQLDKRDVGPLLYKRQDQLGMPLNPAQAAIAAQRLRPKMSLPTVPAVPRDRV